jgi:hypothetical protein
MTSPGGSHAAGRGATHDEFFDVTVQLPPDDLTELISS